MGKDKVKDAEYAKLYYSIYKDKINLKSKLYTKAHRDPLKPIKQKVDIPMIQKMNKLYDSGLYQKEIAKIFGVCTATVNNYIWNPRRRGGGIEL